MEVTTYCKHRFKARPISNSRMITSNIVNIFFQYQCSTKFMLFHLYYRLCWICLMGQMYYPKSVPCHSTQKFFTHRLYLIEKVHLTGFYVSVVKCLWMISLNTSLIYFMQCQSIEGQLSQVLLLDIPDPKQPELRVSIHRLFYQSEAINIYNFNAQQRCILHATPIHWFQKIYIRAWNKKVHVDHGGFKFTIVIVISYLWNLCQWSPSFSKYYGGSRVDCT